MTERSTSIPRILLASLAFLLMGAGCGRSGGNGRLEGQKPVSGYPPPSLTNQAITVNGGYLCLPPVPTNTSTDCVIGIVTGKIGVDAKYYALVGRDLKRVDPAVYSTGIGGGATGYLVDDPEMKAKYLIAGTIMLE